MARTVSDDVRVIDLDKPQKMAELISNEKPSAVIWASDSASKKTAPQVAAILNLGLCADCTRLESDGDTLIMYRPAFSGNVIAKIKALFAKDKKEEDEK
jgi:electron transfer flavoprotein alpha subunit